MPDLYLWRRLRAGRLAWGVPLQAAIAACHACAETAWLTRPNWLRVAEQCEWSARAAGSPVSMLTFDGAWSGVDAAPHGYPPARLIEPLEPFRSRLSLVTCGPPWGVGRWPKGYKLITAVDDFANET
jgi:hypothetical protein